MGYTHPIGKFIQRCIFYQIVGLRGRRRVPWRHSLAPLWIGRKTSEALGSSSASKDQIDFIRTCSLLNTIDARKVQDTSKKGHTGTESLRQWELCKMHFHRDRLKVQDTRTLQRWSEKCKAHKERRWKWIKLLNLLQFVFELKAILVTRPTPSMVHAYLLARL